MGNEDMRKEGRQGSGRVSPQPRGGWGLERGARAGALAVGWQRHHQEARVPGEGSQRRRCCPEQERWKAALLRRHGPAGPPAPCRSDTHMALTLTFAGSETPTRTLGACPGGSRAECA